MRYFFFFLLYSTFLNLTSAQVETINLNLQPVAGGTPQQVTATDDGSGFQMSGSLSLLESSQFTMSINLGGAQNDFINRSEQIQFFFQREFGLFDRISYADADENSLPVGFLSEAVTACTNEDISGHLTIILVDFGTQKKAGNQISDGTKVLEVTWPVMILTDPDAPPCENEEEIITDVVLTWISASDTVVARARDPDGDGPLDLEILDDIELTEGTTYMLFITVLNEIEGEDLTDEIQGEADEHMFFFAFSEGIFSDPSGDGNIDIRSDPVNYLDLDENDLPVGLSTEWTTASSMNSGTFQIILKHQPGTKSTTSTSQDGATDIDLTFNIRSIPTAARDFQTGKNELSIFPNPVRDILNWSLKETLLTQKGNIMIYDLNLRPVAVLQNQESSIAVNELDPGFYILALITGQDRWMEKFLKVP